MKELEGIPSYSEIPRDVPSPLYSLPSSPLYSLPSILPRHSDMDQTTYSSVFPSDHYKTLHLVRHAQGIHNVEGEKDRKAYRAPKYFDAHLSPLGWEQVDYLREHVIETGLLKRIELVITSPLLRTMQTAAGVFGGESYMDGVGVLPLMVANTGNIGPSAISSLNCPPFIAVEYCRERLGVNPCDKRRSINECRNLFPGIDFSLIENNEDVLWKADEREKDDGIAARGMKFLNWLWTRKEKEIAVVTHSAFLQQTLKMFANNCHPNIKNAEIREMSKEYFNNCELCTVVLVDKSMIESGSFNNNYPGKIPRDPDLPSDIAHEQHPEKGCSADRPLLRSLVLVDKSMIGPGSSNYNYPGKKTLGPRSSK